MNYLNLPRFLSFVCVFTLPLLSWGLEYTVTSASQLNALNLVAGDTVIWTDGEYSNQQLNLLKSGTGEAPILIKAETPGGVVFKGDSQINIGAAYVIVDGFYFNESLGSTGVLEFRRSGSGTQFGEHCVVRNCAFDGLQTEGDSKSRWVILYGKNNRVEHCSFMNKDSTGACVLVELAYQTDGTAGHIIENNYFSKFSRKDGRTNFGDSETIRIGVASAQATDAGCLVRHNYFVETDGEPEIVSNKSRNNVYYQNTFRRCRGGLTLRAGSRAMVDGNFFLGEGVLDSGGIRVVDEGHVIINNYMEGLRGESYQAAIVLMGGNQSSGGLGDGYSYIDDVVIAFNTIIDANQSIHLNAKKGLRAPINTTIANNLIYSTAGELITGEEDISLNGVLFEGNIMYGSSVGYASSGISNVDPELAVMNMLYQPESTSPAIDAAVGNYSMVTTDIEGNERPISGKDVGAIEVVGALSQGDNRPITDTDVGGFVGTDYLDANGAAVTYWAGYRVLQQLDGYEQVDTGAYLGMIWIKGDWAYAVALEGWVYMREGSVTPQGAWIYVLK